MCRWMAWHGQPLLIEELLFKPRHGLVDQSLHSRMGAETTNGDGFGVGWYGVGEGPGVYRSISPAWGDPNLRNLAAHIETPLFLAHVRATSGTAVQETNCHPFSHGRCLFVHNGLINEFHLVRKELMLALDGPSFAAIEGSADSEVIFHLALTFGLEDDPLSAIESAVGFVEQTLRRNGIEPALQTSIGVSDGVSLWAVRYSTEGQSRTLFRSGLRRCDQATASGEPPPATAARGRPPRRLRAPRRAGRRVARDPGGDVADDRLGRRGKHARSYRAGERRAAGRRALEADPVADLGDQQGDDAQIRDAVLRLSRSRRMFAPLAFTVGAFALLFDGLRLLVSNWRLTLVQVLPAMWIWLAMFDHKACPRESVGLRGPILIPLGLLVVTITMARFFLNAVFAFAIARSGPPQNRPAVDEARRNLVPILVSGAIVGVLLALSTLVVTRRPTSLVRPLPGDRRRTDDGLLRGRAGPADRGQTDTVRRDRLWTTAVGGALGRRRTPPYLSAGSGS